MAAAPLSLVPVSIGAAALLAPWPIPLRPDGVTTIGRGATSGIADKRLSRQQLAVRCRGPHVYATSLGLNSSVLGTGAELPRGQEVPLSPGDQVALLPGLYGYRLEAADDAEGTAEAETPAPKRRKVVPGLFDTAARKVDAGSGSPRRPRKGRAPARGAAVVEAPGEGDTTIGIEASPAKPPAGDEEYARQLHEELNAGASEEAAGQRPASSAQPALGFQNNYLREAPGLANMAACRLADIVEEGVTEVWGMNYMWDLPFLFEEAPNLRHVSHLLVMIDHRYSGECRADIKALKAQHPHIQFQVHSPPLSDRFGTHHTKAMLLFYPRGLRMMVTTANFIAMDWWHLNQGIWVQDFPLKADGSPTRSDFEEDLCSYLSHCGRKMYGVPTSNILDLSIIRRYDFSAATAHLVGSVPGTHMGPAMQRWGQGRLCALLQREGPLPERFSDGPIVFQYSSMGSLHPNFVHGQLLRSMGGPAQPTTGDLHVVFPAVQEVAQSVIGYRAGGSLPVSAQNWERATFLRPHLCTWRGPAGGPPTLSAARQRYTPHIKTYLRYNRRDPADVAWLLLTSANLSKAAWGELLKNESQLKILSYELGVLLVPSLYACHLASAAQFSCTGTKFIAHPDGARLQTVRLRAATAPVVAASDAHLSVYLPIPYHLPPVPFGADDEPWASDKAYTQPDCTGSSWRD